MFNVIYSMRNANYNYPELTFFTYHAGYPGRSVGQQLLMDYSWEYEKVQLPWRATWEYPSKLKLLLSFNASVLPLEIYSFPCP